MGIKEWFEWFRRHKDGPTFVGTSTGGSPLIKYGGNEFGKPIVGFPDADISELVDLREKVYVQLFGEPETVYHEMPPLVPHIDVYRFPPTKARDFITYITGGMSDLPQCAPDSLGKEVRRVELVFYAAEHDDRYSEFLRRLARFPHDNYSWLHWGHTMPNGSPPEPLFGEGPLDTFLFMPSVVQSDANLNNHLSWRDEPVNLLWCVPITTAECELKLDQGMDAIYDLFDRVHHPFAFTGPRQSYV